MRVLVTGRGSIAQRHVQHLRALVPNAEVAVVSGNGLVDDSMLPCNILSDFESGLTWQPDAIIIASISSRHAHELERCLQLGLPCLAEKPLVTDKAQLVRVIDAWQQQKTKPAVVVGCNLRYLPALQKLRHALNEKRGLKVLRAMLEVGQALSQWRPQRALESSYSAHAQDGGGVVFDLVHEIDMARWLLGPLEVRGAVGGHFSDLPITSDDVHVALLVNTVGAPVVVQLDYVSLQAVRRYSIVTSHGTFTADLAGVASKFISFSNGIKPQIITDDATDFDIKNTYALQMSDWLKAVADSTHTVISPLEDAFKSAGLMLDMKAAAS